PERRRARRHGRRRAARDARRRGPGSPRRGHPRPLSLHRRAAGSRPADPHLRRAPREQLPALADRLQRDPRHRHAVARLQADGPVRGHPGLPEARAQVRRDCAGFAARGSRPVTRILSALVLFPVVLGLVWFFPPVATLLLCLVVLGLSCHEYEALARRTGLQLVPWLATA